MENLFVDNAPDGAWDDAVFTPVSLAPIPGEGRGEGKKPARRRWMLWLLAGLAALSLGCWAWGTEADEVERPARPVARPSLPPPAPVAPRSPAKAALKPPAPQRVVVASPKPPAKKPLSSTARASVGPNP